LDENRLSELLISVAEGRLTPQEAAGQLASFPYDDIGIAKIDTHRSLRTGHPEVIFGLGKTPEQVAEIMSNMAASSKLVIATKASEEQFEAVAEKFVASRSLIPASKSVIAASKAVIPASQSVIPALSRNPQIRKLGFEEASADDFFDEELFSDGTPRLTYFSAAQMIVFDDGTNVRKEGLDSGIEAGMTAVEISDDGTNVRDASGLVCVACGGTADIPIAEEAAITLALYGANVMRHYDVGVAGIHRLLSKVSEIRRADVIVVVAGMEGALASAVGGLVSVPVIAVPTSVGYGASMGGLSALLSMLNSCSLGVSVMNIDNGFGAGHFASLILQKK
jgi:NCAIR mutase (PurE)-related protein